MKPIMQTIFKPPLGNCLQATIASVFELSLNDVPNFAEYFNFDDPDDRKWDDKFQEWLASKGCYSLDLDATQGLDVIWKPRGYHLIGGPSPRGDYDHAIVGHNGEAVHDPFPDGNCELIKHDSWTIFVSIMEET